MHALPAMTSKHSWVEGFFWPEREPYPDWMRQYLCAAFNAAYVKWEPCWDPDNACFLPLPQCLARLKSKPITYATAQEVLTKSLVVSCLPKLHNIYHF